MKRIFSKAAVLLAVALLTTTAMATASPKSGNHTGDIARSLEAKALSAVTEALSSSQASMRVASGAAFTPYIISVETSQPFQQYGKWYIFKIRVVVQVGPGDYDMIALNRFVNIFDPWPRPAVLMVPGSSIDSDSDFEVGRHNPVLGMTKERFNVFTFDPRYSFLPDEFPEGPNGDPPPMESFCASNDCSFMEDWTYESYLKDVDLAAKITWFWKIAEGSAHKGVYGLGHSLGAMTLADTQHEYKDFSGLVLVDMAFEYSPDTYSHLREDADFLVTEVFGPQQSAGIYYNHEFFYARLASYLGEHFPEEQSPIITYLNNYQAALFLLEFTGSPEGDALPLYFRYCMGVNPFDISDLKYTDLNDAFGASANSNSQQPNSIDVNG
jgi:hypothetical protein